MSAMTATSLRIRDRAASAQNLNLDERMLQCLLGAFSPSAQMWFVPFSAPGIAESLT
jgi:hypothetical protein